MRKFIVLSFSLIVTALTVYGLIFPNYLLRELVSFSEPFVLARLLIVLLLFSYAFSPEIRLKGMRQVLLLGSVAAAGFGVTTMISPMFFGSFNSYVPIGDVFVFLEGGIIGLLMASELPVIRPRPAVSPNFVKQIKVIQYKRLINQGF